MTFQHPTCLDDLLHPENELLKVYLAGKIRKNCWRHALVEGLREHHWDSGQLQQKDFIYTGPFFVGCDHGCYHAPNQHGGGNGCKADFDIARTKVAAHCRHAIDQANLVFCYIDAANCYGTIAEIERATMQRIHVVVVFAPGIASREDNDFWFVCVKAQQVHYNVSLDDLPALFNRTLRGLT